MLSGPQIAHFETFGFLLMRRLFSSMEIADIRRAADALWREKRDGLPDQGEHQSVAPFIESSNDLSQLPQDDRIYRPIEQLLGLGFVWGGSEGNKGSFNEEQSHPWQLRPSRRRGAGLRAHQGDVVPDSHKEGDGSAAGDARLASPAIL